MYNYKDSQESEILKSLYKVAEEKQRGNSPIFNSADVVERFPDMIKARTEKVLILYLDNGNRIIKKKIFRGTVDQCALYPREVMKGALLCDASQIIMVHNHPAGVKKFSECDKLITKKLQDAGKTLDIRFIDHILITRYGHLSYKRIMEF